MNNILQKNCKVNWIKWTTGSSILILLLAAGYQFICAFQSIEFLHQNIFLMDDAYYYFKVAQNMTLQGWATFDGIHATSGIQLLWGYILSVVAMLFNGRIEFLRAILVLCIFLNIMAGIMLWRLGRRLYSDEVGNLVTLLWSGFMVGLSPMMLGMEYSLHIVIIIFTIACWWGVLNRGTSITMRQLFVLGILLTLNYWTRLDSAIYSLLIWLSVGFTLFSKRRSLRTYLYQMIVLTSVPVFGLVGYIAISYSLAGTFMPISGAVKAHYAAQHFNGYGLLTSLAGHILWWVRIQCRPMLDIISSVFLSYSLLHPLSLTMVVIVISVTLWGIHRVLRNRIIDRRLYHLTIFLGLLWLFGALHSILIVNTIGHFSHITQHYYGWLMITWILWGALLIYQILTDIRSLSHSRFIIMSMLIIFIIMHGWISFRRFNFDKIPNSIQGRFLVSVWINENIPINERIGAWNAGVLGYFCNCPVINLDGLVNNREFLQYLKSGSSILDYLEKERITYLVDYNYPDMTMPYRATWDKSQIFHNSLPWTVLDIQHVEDKCDPLIYVLRINTD